MVQRKFTMQQEKTTKNKVVYRNLDAPIDTVYIDKDALRQEGVRNFPETLTITLTLEF